MLRRVRLPSRLDQVCHGGRQRARQLCHELVGIVGAPLGQLSLRGLVAVQMRAGVVDHVGQLARALFHARERARRGLVGLLGELVRRVLQRHHGAAASERREQGRVLVGRDRVERLVERALDRGLLARQILLQLVQIGRGRLGGLGQRLHLGVLAVELVARLLQLLGGLLRCGRRRSGHALQVLARLVCERVNGALGGLGVVGDGLARLHGILQLATDLVEGRGCVVGAAVHVRRARVAAAVVSVRAAVSSAVALAVECVVEAIAHSGQVGHARAGGRDERGGDADQIGGVVEAFVHLVHLGRCRARAVEQVNTQVLQVTALVVKRSA
eukprot:Unigene4969_Nuclearia_a/m.15208 Unigene4969_Nuclearia_a/g.15208  ORF Unigene4969_Nuclearia_a/g.15208 Unigene4969_Nuclearia_a/m.15208 type:complete len:328 (-) Unigene4969_Nuclearia_a:3381-4364(-)